MSAVVRIDCAEVKEPPGATWTNALLLGDDIILSGMTPYPQVRDAVEAGEPLDAKGQTLVVLDKIKALVENAGGHIGNIYRLVVYVTNIDDKADVGSARREFFGEHQVLPASTLVEVSNLVFPEVCVEIEAHARLGIDLREAT